MAKEYEVDIDLAKSALKHMADFVDRNRAELDEVEKTAMNSLMGLILTSVHTGLVRNNSPELKELRAKIFMAFDIGYAFGKFRDGKK